MKPTSGARPELRSPVHTGRLPAVLHVAEKDSSRAGLDLKGKINISVDGVSEVEPDTTEELIEVLEGLGYKLVDIKKIIPNVNKDQDIGSQVKEALRLMMK